MSTDKDTGGAAFPEIESRQAGVRGDYYTDVYSVGGMTLRDYFAAKAMAAHIMRHPVDAGGVDYPFDATMAEWAYKQAGAMLEARGKT